MNLRFIATGCAGSGTKWASQLFTDLSVKCGHQQIYRVDGVHPNQRDLLGDVSFFAAPVEVDLPVLLLLRNPLRVVRSLDRMRGFLNERGTNDDMLTWEYIVRHRPIIGEADDRLGRILRYVATWDDSLQARAISGDKVKVLRVERANGGRISRSVEWLAGMKVSHQQCRKALAQLGRSVNTHGGKRSSIMWKDIERHPDGKGVIEKAKHWGYL